MDVGLCEHGVVLELRLAERWGVAGLYELSVHSLLHRDIKLRGIGTYNDNQLGLARSQALERRLVAEHDLTRLHHKRQARVDGVGCLLGLLWCHF